MSCLIKCLGILIENKRRREVSFIWCYEAQEIAPKFGFFAKEIDLIANRIRVYNNKLINFIMTAMRING